MLPGRRVRRLFSSEVARFVAAGLLAACLIGVGTFAVVSKDAETQAIRHAEDITQVEAHGIVQPALTDAVLSRQPAALATLDTLVRQRILGGAVVRLKLWTADGSVIYSDEPRLIGQRFALDSAELASLSTGTPAANVSDLTDSENRYERSFGTLLQVYLAVHTPDGTPLLFETYQRYEAITQYQQSVWSSFLPVLVGGLAVLFLVQIPLALRLARRLRASTLEREALLERAVDASAHERRRIARDLHDGVVQRLAATTFSLSALARRLAGPGAPITVPGPGTDAADAARETRAAMRELRTLIIEIAPPNLHAEGIDNALRDLLEPFRRDGVDVSLEAPHDIALPAGVTTLLFRVAQEAVRNVAKHADATAVRVALRAESRAVRLEVSDNGRGFSEDQAGSRRRDGHVGLSLLRDLVAEAGGTLRVESGAGAGTLVAVEVSRP